MIILPSLASMMWLWSTAANGLHIPTSAPPHRNEYVAQFRKPLFNKQTALQQQNHHCNSRIISTSFRGGAIAATSGSPSIPPSSPPLIAWIVPALSCALSYASYNLSIKKASSSIDPLLGGVLLQIVAAATGAVLLLGRWLSMRGGSGSVAGVAAPGRMGIAWSTAAGLAVGAAELLSFYVSGRGVPATQSIPIIVGGSVLLGTILGNVWLKETVSLKGWVGVILISAGISFIGMDSSGSLH